MNPVLAMVGTPLHWIAVAAAAVILLAPQYIPVVGRILGRLFGMELKRRYGITLKSQAPAPRKSAANIPSEDRNPPPQPVIVREPVVQLQQPVDEPTLAVNSKSETRNLLPVWAVVLLVLAATTVLLWYLLHAR